MLDHVVSEEDVLKDPNKKTTPGRRRATSRRGKEDDQGRRRTRLQGSRRRSAEGTYGVPVIWHQCLESHGLVAEWDADGGLTVWASTQADGRHRAATGRAVRHAGRPR